MNGTMPRPSACPEAFIRPSLPPTVVPTMGQPKTAVKGIGDVPIPYGYFSDLSAKGSYKSLPLRLVSVYTVCLFYHFFLALYLLAPFSQVSRPPRHYHHCLHLKLPQSLPCIYKVFKNVLFF